MISIGVAAAQVGVSTSALRKWESRYGLPPPHRGSGGVRWYTAAEVARLRDIKRRIELGQPPAQAFQAVLSAHAQQPMTPQAAVAPLGLPVGPEAATSALADPSWAGAVLGLLRTQGPAACHRWLQGQRQQLGALGFVEGVAVPLMEAVGTGWAGGEVAVHEEHALAALLQTVLAVPPTSERSATVAVHPTADPRPWLLATLSGEWHTLGLSMLHAMLHEAGVPCINLGASVPNAELVAAAARLGGAQGVQGVALSLSACTAPRAVQRQLQALRRALPAEVALWVGGAGVGCLARLPVGVHAPGSCQAACETMVAHRSTATPSPV